MKAKMYGKTNPKQGRTLDIRSMCENLVLAILWEYRTRPEKPGTRSLTESPGLLFCQNLRPSLSELSHWELRIVACVDGAPCNVVS